MILRQGHCYGWTASGASLAAEVRGASVIAASWRTRRSRRQLGGAQRSWGYCRACIHQASRHYQSLRSCLGCRPTYRSRPPCVSTHKDLGIYHSFWARIARRTALCILTFIRHVPDEQHRAIKEHHTVPSTFHNSRKFAKKAGPHFIDLILLHRVKLPRLSGDEGVRILY